MTYRRRASPLHAARAAAGVLWCLSLLLATLISSHPLMLGALAGAVIGGGVAAGVGRELLRALRWAGALAITIAVINALVTRSGVTVIWRFGDLPILGQTDVTLEATLAGAVLGLRAATLVLIGVLYSTAVDPDEVLRLLRRWSFHSALTATVATRMVPVLVRDGRRLAEAQRCRPGPPPGRAQLLRATTSGALDRALDVAAALEVRGYGAARRRPARRRQPWSRHDVAFTLSAAALLGVAIAGRAAGLTPFQAYPMLHVPLGGWELGLGAALALVALAPFADRRGVAG